ncbi:hypothetical protein GLW20_14145 [Virgibacillus halodenitrificans]|nr:hypothetical protein [Virgibacillus halodenitrificans]
MKLYEHFLKRKQKGELLHLEELSSNDLEILFIEESKSDAMIASLFGVKSSKITYLRRKYGITIRNSLIKDFLDAESNVGMELNTNMIRQILTSENISKISKAVTHFAFRNGPIEDMHADVTKNITDEDMKKLNKYMVNRVAYIFTLILEDRWMEFNYLVENMNLMFGHHWDEVVQDDGGMRELFEKEINKFRI